ncbi:CD36 [Desmophyllum pertusum]|uniref:CD36 n=1 Tax=Desmophyllum pertusum TaxID=174260 RepID=A0A9W9ZSF3_9CNID|nr:CD36 [Desmophyllum pertusum]
MWPPSPVAIPLFVSAPHFYLGDSSLLEAVEGLSPNREEHGTFLNLEPHTGISVKSSKRLQINVKVEPVASISQTSGIRNMFFPVLYINETATIDSASAEKLKSEVLSKFTIVHGIELGLVLLGALLIIIAAIMLIVRIVHNRKLKKIKLMLLVNGNSERSPLLTS